VPDGWVLPNHTDRSGAPRRGGRRILACAPV